MELAGGTRLGSYEIVWALGAGKRSDVWAFGCVLFEMMAGKRAFDRRR